MTGPYFESWEHDNLVKFAKEAYEKLQAQERELQELRLPRQPLTYLNASYEGDDLYTGEQLRAAVAAEREACAKISETLGVHQWLNVYNGGPDWYRHGKNIAAALRARG